VAKRDTWHVPSIADPSWRSNTISAADISPDGTKVLIGIGECATFRVGIDESARLLRPSHIDVVKAAAWDPGERWLACAGKNGNIDVYDARDGSLVQSWTSAGGALRDARWIPARGILVIMSEQGIHLVRPGDDRVISIFAIRAEGGSVLLIRD